MKRLNFVVEGATEREFVKRVLSPFLADYNIVVAPRVLRTKRDRRVGRVYTGGGVKYARVQKEVRNWMREDRGSDAFFTTMIDLYQLNKDFPDYDKSSNLPPFERIKILEMAMDKDIDSPRFFAYISLFEFETLLLVNPEKVKLSFPGQDKAVDQLVEEISELGKPPEEINDGPNTAPSKRIISHVPDYESLKSTAGPEIASAIGLSNIIGNCPHFGAWIETILQKAA